MEKNETLVNTASREIVITRLLNAPRELVFKAWTEPEHLVKWWGPRGFWNSIHEIDVKTGGKWLYTMHGPDGTDYPNWIVFDEVVEPERITYSHGGSKKGDPEDAQFKGIVTFEAEGNKTRLTMRQVFSTAKERNHVVEKYGAIEGGRQTFDKLEEELSTMKAGEEFEVSRELNAPIKLVWDLWTKPEHLAKWWGPKDFEMQDLKLDLREGGMFHYSMKGPGDFIMWGKFVFREVAAPHRLIFLVSFSDEKGGTTRAPMGANWPLEVLSTLTLTEKNGKTVLTMKGVPFHATQEEIATYKAGFSGMQQGFKGTFEQLEEYLQNLKK
jgi:uncharacterized protein YndB with AHSA1/START domain